MVKDVKKGEADKDEDCFEGENLRDTIHNIVSDHRSGLQKRMVYSSTNFPSDTERLK